MGSATRNGWRNSRPRCRASSTRLPTAAIRRAQRRILQEFQSGLRPELLDKEQIKSRVRQMLLGDQSSADLANEIAQELSSELGREPGAGAAGGRRHAEHGRHAADWRAGRAGRCAAGRELSVNKWAATVTGMVSTFDNTGRTAGNAFGTGFMAVQGAYIDQWAAALVSIVTAGVLANMAAQASRTRGALNGQRSMG